MLKNSNWFKKPKKITLVIFLISAIATIPWFIFVRNYASSHLVKTEATVIKLDPTKNIYEPVYTYRDASGNEYTEKAREGYSITPSPFNLIYGLRVDVGDKLPLYYEKINPSSTYLIYGFSKGFMIMPIYLAFHIIVFINFVWFMVLLGFKYRTRKFI